MPFTSTPPKSVEMSASSKLLTRMVPAGVPSDFHSSVVAASGRVMKYTCPPAPTTCAGSEGGSDRSDADASMS